MHEAQLRRALDWQITHGRGRRNGHWLGLAVAIPLSFLMFAFLSSRGITEPWAMVFTSISTGWFILKDMYWATYWENYMYEAEATREAMG